jgi:hypothetical protein
MHPSHSQHPEPHQPEQQAYGHGSACPRPNTHHVDIRKYRMAMWLVIALWFGVGSIIMALGVFGLVPHPMFEDVDPQEMPAPLMPFVALVVIAVVVAMLPSRLAEQWAVVDGRGVTLAQKPYWWTRGGTLYLPWESITSYRSYWKRPYRSNSARIPKLTIKVRGQTSPLGIPSWVTTDLTAGYHLRLSRWGRNRVHKALRAVRPDLDRTG